MEDMKLDDWGDVLTWIGKKPLKSLMKARDIMRERAREINVQTGTDKLYTMNEVRYFMCGEKGKYIQGIGFDMSRNITDISATIFVASACDVIRQKEREKKYKFIYKVIYYLTGILIRWKLSTGSYFLGCYNFVLPSDPKLKKIAWKKWRRWLEK